jgi:pimeloyl-ACP methyl ester carboxylesterase
MATLTTDIRRVQANGIDFAYLEAGPQDGPLALCLHGFPDHARTWRHLLPALADAGWHAVAPWMRGYHPTGLAPDGRYQSAVLSQDAVALVEALGDRRAVIIGHDWGAIAASGAAILAPERMSRVVCMTIPHLGVAFAKALDDWGQMKRFWYMWWLLLPGIYEMSVSADDVAFAEKLWRDWSPSMTIDREDMTEIRGMLSRPEVLAAATQYYRQLLDGTQQSDDLLDVQLAVQSDPITIPVLWIGGVEDGCFGAEFLQESAEYCTAECRVELLEDCGHFLQLERPDAVNRLILDYIGPGSEA